MGSLPVRASRYEATAYMRLVASLSLATLCSTKFSGLGSVAAETSAIDQNQTGSFSVAVQPH